MAFVFWSVSFYPQVYTNWKRKAYVDDAVCLVGDHGAR